MDCKWVVSVDRDLRVDFSNISCSVCERVVSHSSVVAVPSQLSQTCPGKKQGAPGKIERLSDHFEAGREHRMHRKVNEIIDRLNAQQGQYGKSDVADAITIETVKNMLDQPQFKKRRKMKHLLYEPSNYIAGSINRDNTITDKVNDLIDAWNEGCEQ